MKDILVLISWILLALQLSLFVYTLVRFWIDDRKVKKLCKRLNELIQLWERDE